MEPSRRLDQMSRMTAAMGIYDQQNPFIVNAGIDPVKDPLIVSCSSIRASNEADWDFLNLAENG